MNLEELKEKYFKLRRITGLNTCSLKECISKLPPEGLNDLYELYDVSELNIKTKQARINYLVREIPGQFLDDFRFMMDDNERKRLIDFLNGGAFTIEYDTIHLFRFGFLFINENDNFIFPDELEWFLIDLFSFKK